MSKKHKAIIAEAKFTLTQEDNCSGDDSPCLDLIVKSRGGGGKYLAIETRRWPIDSIDELIDLLKQVKEATGEDQ